MFPKKNSQSKANLLRIPDETHPAQRWPICIQPVGFNARQSPTSVKFRRWLRCTPVCATQQRWSHGDSSQGAWGAQVHVEIIWWYYHITSILPILISYTYTIHVLYIYIYTWQSKHVESIYRYHCCLYLRKFLALLTPIHHVPSSWIVPRCNKVPALQGRWFFTDPAVGVGQNSWTHMVTNTSLTGWWMDVRSNVPQK